MNFDKIFETFNEIFNDKSLFNGKFDENDVKKNDYYHYVEKQWTDGQLVSGVEKEYKDGKWVKNESVANTIENKSCDCKEKCCSENCKCNEKDIKNIDVISAKLKTDDVYKKSQDYIAKLKKEIAHLTDENATLKEENKQLQFKIKTSEKYCKKLEDKINTIKNLF